ncbi:polycystin-2-like protein 2 [Drosophila tropicalis]|uniref:polycystin-2-like protein 2 n=1 Tax=Drosophila tropicalis TaxID=46794 RepID=UPI0035ABE825
MNRTRVNNIIFFVTTFIVLIASLVMICVFSGFEHEMKMFKTMLNTIVLILLLQFLVFDPIKFVILAIDAATWGHQSQNQEKPETGHYNHFDYLKMRLRSLRSQLKITEEHRNEKLNQKYHIIAKDVYLYGTYFIMLLAFVLVQENALLFYNTKSVQRLLNENQTNTYGLSKIYHLNEIYYFIEKTLINQFDSHLNHNNVWSIEQIKMLGVVRLRQVRPVDNHIGLYAPEWDVRTFLPEWQLPYQRIHYTEKFWRIYEPWQPLVHNPSLLNGLLLNFNHVGSFQSYPELNGYIAMLKLNKKDNIIVLQHLKEHNWLNYNTSAIFMDFTLYNADANMFTKCTLLVENTSFGIQIPSINVQSAILIADLHQQSHAEFIIVILYFLALLQFISSLVVKIWFDPREIRNKWNQLDIVICFLNIFLAFLTFMRGTEVGYILHMVEKAAETEFYDFHRPIRLFLFTLVVMGFLISLTTIRLWKVFQFASVFQVFTRTLYMAWTAVLSTGVIILILLMAFGISVSIINGDYSLNFYHLTNSIVSCMCFAMGFTSHMNPTDMFFGGSLVGIILYLTLVFFVAIILINVFASTIYDYFEKVDKLAKENEKRQINFIQFLQLEYGHWLRCCRNWFGIHKGYRRNNRTVSQNIRRELDEHERYEALMPRIAIKRKISEYEKNLNYRRSLERSYCLVSIMRVQINLLERMLFGDKDGNLEALSDSDYTSDSDIPEMYRKEKKKVKFNAD